MGHIRLYWRELLLTRVACSTERACYKYSLIVTALGPSAKYWGAFLAYRRLAYQRGALTHEFLPIGILPPVSEKDLPANFQWSCGVLAPPGFLTPYFWPLSFKWNLFSPEWTMNSLYNRTKKHCFANANRVGRSKHFGNEVHMCSKRMMIKIRHEYV